VTLSVSHTSGLPDFMQKHCIIILWGSLRRKELKPMNKTLAGHTQNPEKKKKIRLG